MLQGTTQEVITSEMDIRSKFVQGPRYKNQYHLDNKIIEPRKGFDLRQLFGKTTDLEIKFFNCTFKSTLWLSDVSDLDHLEFMFCEFITSIIFKNPKFNTLIFSVCDFHDRGELEFIAKNKLKFEQIKRYGTDIFEIKSESVENTEVEFWKLKFIDKGSFILWDLNFGNKATFKDCDLTRTFFRNSNITNVKFLNCEFERYSPTKFNSLILKKLSEEQLNSYKQKLISYRELEINFDKNKDYEQAGEFHKLRYDLELRITNWGIGNFEFLKKIFLILYKSSSDFGESYGKSLKLYIITLLIFSLLFLITGLIYLDPDTKINPFVIYYFKGQNIYSFWNDWSLSLLYSLNSSLPFRKEMNYIKPANDWTTFFSISETLIQTILATLFIIGLRSFLNQL